MLLFEKLKAGESYKSFLDDYTDPKNEILVVVFESDRFWITSSNNYSHIGENKPLDHISNIYHHPDLEIVKKSAEYMLVFKINKILDDIRLELSIENRKRKIEKLLKYDY